MVTGRKYTEGDRRTIGLTFCGDLSLEYEDASFTTCFHGWKQDVNLILDQEIVLNTSSAEEKSALKHYSGMTTSQSNTSAFVKITESQICRGWKGRLEII